jgi:hypothetical protein
MNTNFETIVVSGAMACAVILLAFGSHGALGQTTQPASTADETVAVTAIDIALEPDATMIARAEAVNADLRLDYPKGFALGDVHKPHISMLQRYVRTADLEEVYDAAAKVVAADNVTSLKLTAHRIYYYTDPSLPGLGLSNIVMESTPDLLKLQQDLIDAVAPYTEKTGTAAAFVTTPAEPDINDATIHFIEVFVPEHSGDHFLPHVTTGLATVEYLEKLCAKPFDEFTFSPVGVSVYHLGNFGTAREQLKALNLNP